MLSGLVDRRRLLVGARASLLAGRAPPGRCSVDAPPALARFPTAPIYEPPATLRAVFDLCRRMTAPVRVNGRGPFPFVVDTGANQSVISAGLAAQLGLAQGPPELLNSTTGAQMAPTTKAELVIGDRVETDVVLSILPEYGMGGVGMLGVNRLEGQRLTLDFARQRIMIDVGRPAAAQSERRRHAGPPPRRPTHSGRRRLRRRPGRRLHRLRR